MSQIEGGRWDSIVRKLFNISAPAAMPAIADELIPTVSVQDWEPELYALRRERLLVGLGNSGAVAAEFSHVGVTNPANSSVLIILEQFEVFGGVQDYIFATSSEELTTGLGWVLSSYGNADLRWPGVGTTAATLATARLVVLTSAVGQGSQIWRSPGSNLGGRQAPLNSFSVILPPDTGFLVRGSNVNAVTRCSFAWRERPFNPQEGP